MPNIVIGDIQNVSFKKPFHTGTLHENENIVGVSTYQQN
jgi:hypothetical protein